MNPSNCACPIHKRGFCRRSMSNVAIIWAFVFGIGLFVVIGGIV